MIGETVPHHCGPNIVEQVDRHADVFRHGTGGHERRDTSRDKAFLHHECSLLGCPAHPDDPMPDFSFRRLRPGTLALCPAISDALWYAELMRTARFKHFNAYEFGLCR